jgi:uncharacterized membrane protein
VFRVLISHFTHKNTYENISTRKEEDNDSGPSPLPFVCTIVYIGGRIINLAKITIIPLMSPYVILKVFYLIVSVFVRSF